MDLKLIELGSAHCLSTPGFNWDIMLWFSDVDLKLVADIEKYQFLKITRGVVFM